jgi:predicted membrane-bound spermidine synthase
MRLPMLKSNAVRLFLISFLVLFLELACIRWLSSYILYLGYFTNFVLLGCFLGMGAGALLAPKPTRLIKWLPTLMLVFFTAILFMRAEIAPNSANFIYFTSGSLWSVVKLPSYVLLPIIFVSITAIFTALTQDLGSLLTEFAPLKAYNLNILGSLAGIVGFTLMSFFALPAWVWLLLAGILLVPLLPRGRSFGNNLFILAGVVVIFAASDYAYANIWSPYQRLQLTEVHGNNVAPVRPSQSSDPGGHYILFVNEAGHQEFTTLKQSPLFYQLPYSAFAEKPAFTNVLVIGAGGGNDVAFALANGANHVDAVEIDPRIASLGKKFHPEHPYDDPRVSLYIDDARSFLEKTNAKYDLVIFALPDSQVLAASTSNIRLESYLFTLESFQSVKSHLKSDGLLVLYNFYRYPWLVDKINSMLYQVFGQPPVVHRYSEAAYASMEFATIFAGPKAGEIDISQPGFAQATIQPMVPATDNWPFLYIKTPSLPWFYSGTLLIILLFSAIYVWRISPKGSFGQHSLPFFFMGAAFTLLEAKSIVQFLLLFGSTWLVNSLVFFGVLLVVLIANLLASRFKFTKMWILYGLLFLSSVSLPV